MEVLILILLTGSLFLNVIILAEVSLMSKVIRRNIDPSSMNRMYSNEISDLYKLMIRIDTKLNETLKKQGRV